MITCKAGDNFDFLLSLSLGVDSSVSMVIGVSEVDRDSMA